MNELTNDNGGLWIFALLILLMVSGGNGFGWGNRGGEQYATTSDVQAGFNNQDINAQLRGITNGLSDLGFSLDNTINSGFTNVGDKICAMNLDQQKNIDALRFDMSNYNAQTVAAIHREGEATRDMLQRNKIEELQAQVNNLQMQNTINAATFGTVKYPTQASWSMGGNPFCPTVCNGNAY